MFNEGNTALLASLLQGCYNSGYFCSAYSGVLHDRQCKCLYISALRVGRCFALTLFLSLRSCVPCFVAVLVVLGGAGIRSISPERCRGCGGRACRRGGRRYHIEDSPYPPKESIKREREKNCTKNRPWDSYEDSPYIP